MDNDKITHFIQSWSSPDSNYFIKNINLLTKNEKYTLNVETLKNETETHILNVIGFHYQQYQKHTCITNDEPTIWHKNIDIDYQYITNSNNHYFEYDKNKKTHPLFSVIYFGNDETGTIISSSLDIETYKYKEIPNDKQIVFSVLNKNDYLVFDSSKYHRNLNKHQPYLKINVWKKQKLDNYNLHPCEFTSLPKGEISTSTNGVFLPKENTDIIYGNIYQPYIYEKILYDDVIDNLYEQIFSQFVNGSICGLIVVNIKNTEKKSIEYLTEKYGLEIARDIYPFVCNNTLPSNTPTNATYYTNNIILPENRFQTNKIIQNLLSTDVCYWIINECHSAFGGIHNISLKGECQKNNQWETTGYKNYGKTIDLEKIPSVFNFIMFVSNFWLNHIKTMFSISVIELNIKKCFVSKYSFDCPSEINKDEKNTDETFFTLNIQLNDTNDFKGGEIIFDETNKILLKQGDLLLYNGKKERTNGGICSGEKYVLVLFIDIIV